jgi:hypothetical protein
MTDPEVVYAGTDDGRVWVMVDSNVEWTDQTSGLPERWVTDIAVDPVDPLTAYVTFSGLKWKDPASHIFKTLDAGDSWIDVGTGLPDVPLNAVTIDPANPSLVFAGSDIGVFVSEDAGASWQILDSGMPAAAVYDLDIHAESRRLLASTHGRSIFQTTLPALQVSTADESVPTDVHASLETWPNPSTGTLFLRVHGGGDWSEVLMSGARDSPVSFEVFDLRGRLVRTLSGTSAAAEWDRRTDAGVKVPAGRYLIRARVGSRRVPAQMVVLLGND